nr:zinc finger, CCHC-type [Tanacetum cinerariifolium]
MSLNKLILELANIDIEIEDEDQALMLLTDYEFKGVEEKNSGTKEETGDELYVRGRSDHSGKAHSTGSSRFKSSDGSGKLKCFICHSKGHLKRDRPMKKSSGFVKKGKRDQSSDSSDDEGNAYFGEALVVVRNDEMIELVMDLGGSYHMKHMRDFFYDFTVVDDGSVQLGDNRTCTIKRTGKVKVQFYDGSSFILEDVKYVSRNKDQVSNLGADGYDSADVMMAMGNAVYGRQRSTQYCTKSGVAKHLGVAGIQQQNREQHSTWKLFSYREDSNEAAFAGAAVEFNL